MKSVQKIVLSFFILFMALPGVFSQEELRIKKSEFKTVKEGFRDAWKAVRKGDSFYEMGGGYYKNAREHYLTAYQYNPSNPELNYKIGICYLFIDNKYEGIKYLRNAYELENYVARDIHYWLGRGHHLVMEFDRAVKEYETYRNSLTPKELKRGKYFDVEKLIDECHNGSQLVEEPLRVIINNMGGAINSEFDDYNSVFAMDDSVLFFTSRRPVDKKSEHALLDNKFYENIYRSSKFGDDWQIAERMAKPINKDERHNSIIGASPDASTLYVYNGRKGSGDIQYTYLNEKSKWKKPKKFIKVISTNYIESSFTFSPSGDTIYYISTNPGTMGGKDIFYTFKWAAQGKEPRWQPPRNLGSTVNSPYDEEGVFMAPDGKTLYFSSKGHNTMGGYDIFSTELQENGTWSDPVNLGYPINKPDDELFYKVSKSGRYGYYSALRDGGIGEKDIYKIIYLGEEKEMLLSYEDIEIAGVLDSVYHIFFRDPMALEIDTTLVMKGVITDKKTGEPVKAKLELVDPDESEVIATAVSNDKGEYKVKLKEKKDYGVEIVAKEYLVYIDVVELTKEKSDEIVIKDFQIEKLEKDKPIVLENIYFDLGKTTLKPESYPELDKLVKLLEENEGMRIEVSGHTDNIGSFKFNQKLSEGRAKAVVDYLTGHGISKSRLEYAGYAFSQPVAPNDTEEGRARNRRVEFKILSME